MQLSLVPFFPMPHLTMAIKGQKEIAKTATTTMPNPRKREILSVPANAREGEKERNRDKKRNKGRIHRPA